MSGAAEAAELAFAEAVAQCARPPSSANPWSSRATYWTAVRFGLGRLHHADWPAARGEWNALWEIAAREHLAPIPGAPEVGASRSAAAAEGNLARMRAIVRRGNNVHS